MKGSSMNFLIGLVVALFMFAIIGSIVIGAIFNAQSAAEGCGPLASVISDITAGGLEVC